MAQHPQDVRRWFKVLQPLERDNRLLFEGLGAPRFVPWALVEAHAAQCMKNHSQTVERLDARGGLSPDELCAVLEDRRWSPLPLQLAIETLAGHVAKFEVIA